LSHTHRERAAALGAALVALALCHPVREAHAQADLFQELKSVEDVSFEGADHVSQGTLRRVLKTRSPSFWPWSDKVRLRLDFLRADTAAIRSVYRHAGFLDASSTYRVDPGGRADRVKVVFGVTEGPRTDIRAIDILDVQPKLEKEIRNKIWAQPKKPFDPSYLQLDTLVISTIYQNHGYRPHVGGWAAIDTTRHIAHVTYTIREGPQYRVGEIYPYGYDPIARKLVMRELVLRPGAVDSRDKVVRSQERLYDTGLFNQVQFSAIPDSARRLVDYQVRARARPRRWLELALASSSSEILNLSSSWGYKNIAGRGIQGGIGGSIALDDSLNFKRSRIDLGLVEPWPFGVRIRLNVNPYLEWFNDRTQPDYVLHQMFTGFDYGFRRDLNRYATVSLTQRNLLATQQLTFGPGASDSAKTAVTAATADEYRTHSVQLAFQRDLRDNLLLTRQGNVSIVSFEVAGGALNGRSNFHKAELAQSWFMPVRRGVLAIRLRGGVIYPFGPQDSIAASPDPQVARVPLNDRFRTGGVNSLRGYGENLLPPSPASGGLALLLANFELRWPVARLPVLGNFGFEFFVDAGNVWARPEYIHLQQFRPSISHTPLSDQDVRYVFGIGPRLDLPIGPLRVDFSWNFRPSNEGTQTRGYLEPRIQFAIGPSI
jgi:outer membrane protein assembly complex protein YaeT